jgi:hypothetical protein
MLTCLTNFHLHLASAYCAHVLGSSQALGLDKTGFVMASFYLANAIATVCLPRYGLLYIRIFIP